MLSAADREIRLGLWKIHILFHAVRRDVWGTWLLHELAGHGYELSPGTLYPALARMERNGWLERNGTGMHARARQTFRITAEGRRLLRSLRHELTELTELCEEVVLGRESEPAGAPPASQRTKSPRLRPLRKLRVRR